MIKETIERINKRATREYSEARWMITDSFLKFGMGMAFVIAMAVYPFVFQNAGVEFSDPAAPVYLAISAGLMGVVLTFAWVLRFKNDRKQFATFKVQTLNDLNKLAVAMTDAQVRMGETQTVIVKEDLKTPQLVLR